MKPVVYVSWGEQDIIQIKDLSGKLYIAKRSLESYPRFSVDTKRKDLENWFCEQGLKPLELTHWVDKAVKRFLLVYSKCGEGKKLDRAANTLVSVAQKLKWGI